MLYAAATPGTQGAKGTVTIQENLFDSMILDKFLAPTFLNDTRRELSALGWSFGSPSGKKARSTGLRCSSSAVLAAERRSRACSVVARVNRRFGRERSLANLSIGLRWPWTGSATNRTCVS